MHLSLLWQDVFVDPLVEPLFSQTRTQPAALFSRSLTPRCEANHTKNGAGNGNGVLRRASAPAARLALPVLLTAPARHLSPRRAGTAPPAPNPSSLVRPCPRPRPRQDLPALLLLFLWTRGDAARGRAPAGPGDAGRPPGAGLLRRAQRPSRRARRVQGLLHERYVLALLPLPGLPLALTDTVLPIRQRSKGCLCNLACVACDPNPILVS